MRRVISLWLPRFATDRLCRTQDWLRVRPFAIAGAIDQRQILTAVNREAERKGLRPGMALADARAILPALITRPADHDGDGKALAALADWCARFSPFVAIDASGHALWLDATGCAHLFDGEQALCAALVARLAALGYAARAALADTPGAAWAAARYAAGGRALVVPPGGARDMLATLPAAALRLTSATIAGLNALGLRSVGDLYALPRAAIAARLGPEITARLDAALGVVFEPISPAAPAVSYSARKAFAEPISRPEDIAAALDLLLGQLCEMLERAALGARRLTFTAFHADGACQRLAIGTSRPSRDCAHLARLFGERLAQIDPGFGIDAALLAATVLEALPLTQLGATGAGDDEIARLVDRLSNRLKPENVLMFAARESHMPERAAAALPALDVLPAPWPSHDSAPPRPIRLFARPEPIEAVAPVPDDPPVLFRWRRILHRVARAEGPERIAPEWWRANGAAIDLSGSDTARLRDYYRIEDTSGSRFWVFREGLFRADAQPAWFMHGIWG
jgi:protein ImuB